METKKIKINLLEAKKGINNVISVVNMSTVLPILENVLIRVIDGRIKFMATDLENLNEYEVPTRSESKVTFSVLVEKPILHSFINKTTEKEIYLEYTKNSLKMIAGEFSFKMAINEEDINSFPATPILEKEEYLSLNAETLSDTLNKAVPYVSNDDLRPSMTGVYLHNVNNKLTICATNAHRLFHFGFYPKVPSTLLDAGIIVPQKAANIISKQFIKGEVDINITSTHIRVSNSEYCFTARLIDARFPDYKVVLVKWDYKIQLLRNNLIALLKMSDGFVNASTKQIKLQLTKEGKIIARGGDMDFNNEFEYSIPVFYDPSVKEKKEIEIAFNCRFLLKSLMTNRKDKYVVLQVPPENNKGVVIDDHILIMPLMINQ